MNNSEKKMQQIHSITGSSVVLSTAYGGRWQAKMKNLSDMVGAGETTEEALDKLVAKLSDADKADADKAKNALLNAQKVYDSKQKKADLWLPLITPSNIEET